MIQIIDFSHSGELIEDCGKTSVKQILHNMGLQRLQMCLLNIAGRYMRYKVMQKTLNKYNAYHLS